MKKKKDEIWLSLLIIFFFFFKSLKKKSTGSFINRMPANINGSLDNILKGFLISLLIL